MRSPRVYWRALRREWHRNGWESTDTGWLLSLTIAIVLLNVGLLEDCANEACVSKYEQFLRLKPSEMGDTIAGLFSGLAFIWIIVTVFMQSRELREQRNEIRHQRVATQAMARAMTSQARIFESEQRQRGEDRYQLEFEAQLSNTKKLVLEISSYDGFVEWLFDLRDHANFGGMGVTTKRWNTYDSVENDDQFFDQLNKSVTESAFPTSSRSARAYEGNCDIENLEMICNQLEVLVDFETRLSVAQKTRIDTLRLQDTLEVLVEVIAEPKQYLKPNQEAETK